MVPLNLGPGVDEPDPETAAGGALGAAPAAPAVAPTVPVTVALGGATATVVAAATELLPVTDPPKLPVLGGTDLAVWPA